MDEPLRNSLWNILVEDVFSNEVMYYAGSTREDFRNLARLLWRGIFKEP